MAVERKYRKDSVAKELLSPKKGQESAGFMQPALPVFIPPALDIQMEFKPKMTAAQFMDSIEPLIKRYGEDQIKSVLSQIGRELKLALDQALRAPVWAFNDGARDIFDTGALMASGQVITSGLQLTVVYGADYAMLVHNGGYIYPYGNKNLQPIFLPGRPWIRSVLFGGGPVPQFDFTAALERALG